MIQPMVFLLCPHLTRRECGLCSAHLWETESPEPSTILARRTFENSGPNLNFCCAAPLSTLGALTKSPSRDTH